MMQVGAGFIVGHIFNAHDQNEDGVLDKEEVAKMPAENREHARIAKADLNNDGVVNNMDILAWPRLAADSNPDEPKSNGK